MRRLGWWLVGVVALAGCGAVRKSPDAGVPVADAGGHDAGPPFTGSETPGTGCADCCTIRNVDGPTLPDGGYPCSGGEGCNGPEDCPGQVCCYQATCGNVVGYSTGCTDHCDLIPESHCGGPGPVFQLCLSTADCPAGLTCVAPDFGGQPMATNAGLCR